VVIMKVRINVAVLKSLNLPGYPDYAGYYLVDCVTPHLDPPIYEDVLSKHAVGHQVGCYEGDRTIDWFLVHPDKLWEFLGQLSKQFGPDRQVQIYLPGKSRRVRRWLPGSLANAQVLLPGGE